jgi:ATP-dependent Clp protease ATP-binding subunit ClpC
VLRRLELPYDECVAQLADRQLVHKTSWAKMTEVATSLGRPTYTGAIMFAGFFHLLPELEAVLTKRKLSLNDLDAATRWSIRLGVIANAKDPSGGIARDWDAGYAPTLARFGRNLGTQVEFAGKYYQLEERTTQLDALVESLNGATGSVVMVGEPGIGKSALLLGLADRILQGAQSGRLAHYQIISLDASRILAETSGGGTNIEEVVLGLISEATRAGNILLALDEAQLFFGQGTGAVNLSQILLPVLQSHQLAIVLAVTPGDWQKLRATNTAMASMLTPLILSEPDEAATIQTLADRALLLETPGITITYSALVEAYRLSGRYLQDEAYPGRALKLLEASLVHPQNGRIAPTSVQQAVESQFGVKVQSAGAAESNVLLNLEDRIHERMINQTRAVGVVANALRRARAGVSNPKRPLGSFLFLGPTGVGKTELAKSLAAIYFGSENNVIRLDMSEYQQPEDAERILEDAGTNANALLPKVRSTPFSVVLFDEIEKAHPNILNLFLQLLDEGSLTDHSDRAASFRHHHHRYLQYRRR